MKYGLYIADGGGGVKGRAEREAGARSLRGHQPPTRNRLENASENVQAAAFSSPTNATMSRLKADLLGAASRPVAFQTGCPAPASTRWV